jgi:hypothetical protein
MRRCRECGREQPITAFARDATRSDGRRYDCRTCQRARGRRYRAERAARHAADPAWAPPVEKYCGRCCKVQPGWGFTTDPGSRDGLYAWCRRCQQVYRAARRARADLAAQPLTAAHTRELRWIRQGENTWDCMAGDDLWVLERDHTGAPWYLLNLQGNADAMRESHVTYTRRQAHRMIKEHYAAKGDDA